MHTVSPRAFRFEGYTLDLMRCALLRGGKEVVLRPKSFDVLRYLAEHAGRLVSKDELIQAVWPELHVTDDSLVQCIGEIREALGDDARQIIRTVPRRGYAFDAKVVAERAPDSIRVPLTRSPDMASIAVLPLRYLGADPNLEYVADGLTEDIINALSRFCSLFVISPMTAFAYKGRTIEASQAGDELAVGYIVEGSVRVAGDRIRVAADLTDARAGSVLWSETYEDHLDDILAIQIKIARAAAASIEPELSASEADRAGEGDGSSWSTRAPYYQSLKYLYTFTEGGLDKAERLLTEANCVERQSAAALARLGYVHVQRFWYGPHEAREAEVRAAFEYGQRAIALDQREAFGHFVIGRALALQAQYDQAIIELRLAIQLNPSFAQAYFGLGQALFYGDRAEESLEYLDMALQLSPRDPHLWTFHHVRALALFDLRRLDEAEMAAIRATHSPNATHWAFATLLAVLGAQGKSRDAARAAAQLLRLKSGYTCSFARMEFSGFMRDEFVDEYIAGLNAAGLPR